MSLELNHHLLLPKFYVKPLTFICQKRSSHFDHASDVVKATVILITGIVVIVIVVIPSIMVTISVIVITGILL